MDTGKKAQTKAEKELRQADVDQSADQSGATGPELDDRI